MNPKSLFASKTFWVNLLGGIGTVAGAYGGFIPPQYAPIVMGAGAIANILLRMVTHQPVTLSTPTVPPSVVGPGKVAFVVLATALGLTAASCASLPRNPDGTLNVPTLLSWAEDGIVADCAIQGASADVCSLGLPAIQAVEAAVKSDPANAEAKARVGLQAAESRWPAIAPYLDWLIRILPA